VHLYACVCRVCVFACLHERACVRACVCLCVCMRMLSAVVSLSTFVTVVLAISGGMRLRYPAWQETFISSFISSFRSSLSPCPPPSLPALPSLCQTRALVALILSAAGTVVPLVVERVGGDPAVTSSPILGM
jgi:Mg/Co/Ni transporter MgtE